jgi:hypothetical protein
MVYLKGRLLGVFAALLLLLLPKASAQGPTKGFTESFSMGEAMDSTLALLSGTSSPSNNSFCIQNMKELMIRNSIIPSASYLRNNLTDAQLLRLGILASIALISPWDQDPNGKFFISDRGILVEDYHPSSSESDIMLCVVCTLLSIIVLFHVTSAQHLYVMAEAPATTTTTTSTTSTTK